MRRDYRIERAEQIELLASPLRQEIVDAVRALGTCSVRELARQLGTPADRLYYHLRKLLAAGLLVSEGKRSATRRHEEVFRTPGQLMRIAVDLGDVRIAGAIRGATAGVLRMARRDFERGSRSRLARPTGPHRNLGGARLTGWLTREQTTGVNRHLSQIEQIFRTSHRGRGRTLHALTWVTSPLEPKRTRNR